MFVYQPRQFSEYIYEPLRHDNLSSAGVRETVFERLDKFLELNMDVVVDGDDLANWERFMSYALMGGNFLYFPDSNGTESIDCLLEDTKWEAAYRSPGHKKFSIRLRQGLVGPRRKTRSP